MTTLSKKMASLDGPPDGLSQSGYYKMQASGDLRKFFFQFFFCKAVTLDGTLVLLIQQRFVSNINFPKRVSSFVIIFPPFNFRVLGKLKVEEMQFSFFQPISSKA